jgi:hypothetical protein
MLARTWEELEFWLDVLCATQGAHIEVCWVYEKKFMYQSNKFGSHFSWQFIMFDWIVKLVKDFWPTLYCSINHT